MRKEPKSAKREPRIVKNLTFPSEPMPAGAKKSLQIHGRGREFSSNLKQLLRRGKQSVDSRYWADSAASRTCEYLGSFVDLDDASNETEPVEGAR